MCKHRKCLAFLATVVYQQQKKKVHITYGHYELNHLPFLITNNLETQYYLIILLAVGYKKEQQ
jgi:hypothetical protein